MLGHLKLEFGAYLKFACLTVGREFVIWDFRRHALRSLRNRSGFIGFLK